MKKLRKLILAIVVLVILSAIVFGIYRTSYAERSEDTIYKMKGIVMKLEALSLITF